MESKTADPLTEEQLRNVEYQLGEWRREEEQYHNMVTVSLSSECPCASAGTMNPA